MGKILSLGAAIKSTVYYQSFNIKGFFFFPRSWVPGRVSFSVINLISEDVEDSVFRPFGHINILLKTFYDIFILKIG